MPYKLNPCNPCPCHPKKRYYVTHRRISNEPTLKTLARFDNSRGSTTGTVLQQATNFSSRSLCIDHVDGSVYSVTNQGFVTKFKADGTWVWTSATAGWGGFATIDEPTLSLNSDRTQITVAGQGIYSFRTTDGALVWSASATLFPAEALQPGLGSWIGSDFYSHWFDGSGVSRKIYKHDSTGARTTFWTNPLSFTYQQFVFGMQVVAGQVYVLFYGSVGGSLNGPILATLSGPNVVTVVGRKTDQRWNGLWKYGDGTFGSTRETAVHIIRFNANAALSLVWEFAGPPAPKIGQTNCGARIAVDSSNRTYVASGAFTLDRYTNAGASDYSYTPTGTGPSNARSRSVALNSANGNVFVGGDRLTETA